MRWHYKRTEKKVPFQDMRDPSYYIFKKQYTTGCSWIFGGVLQFPRCFHLQFDTFSVLPPFLTPASLLIFLYKSNRLLENIWPHLYLYHAVDDSQMALQVIGMGHFNWVVRTEQQVTHTQQTKHFILVEHIETWYHPVISWLAFTNIPLLTKFQCVYLQGRVVSSKHHLHVWTLPTKGFWI